MTTLSQSTPVTVAIGTRMPDDTVFAGTSPTTGRPMYVAAADDSKKSPSLTMTWHEAVFVARRKQALCQGDWRLPTAEELHVLFNNRAAIGGFNQSGTGQEAWYWSSKEYGSVVGKEAWIERFSNGDKCLSSKNDDLSVRFVRG